ncbi:helix-turn-helix domain-containing protein [Litoreibacter albidus]|uniref:Helix-turn-helix domain-containing protein n=1 Tax=Litoreibacter albidus TaxID=670155 RepID=A0A1H2YTV0_9RHOB|nr:helix-turn-helix domain-containing protein [Litoreibacter albidus]SDX08622.1 Helix-turn-helix domain-containing protein [Litoreibacter albidus]
MDSLTKKGQYPNSWNKRRFDWKKDLNRSFELSRSAKQCGNVLCDQFVGRETGQCWPSNKTLAKAMRVGVRSIQRYIKELIEQGWLQEVNIPRRRRTLQIASPKQAKHDSEGDTEGDSHRSRMSSEGDSTVAPYIEPSKNQVELANSNAALSWHPVGESEPSIIAQWKAYLTSAGYEDVDAVLLLVKIGDAYRLPCRYPKSSEQDQIGYKLFFARVLASNGRCVC